MKHAWKISYLVALTFCVDALGGQVDEVTKMGRRVYFQMPIPMVRSLSSRFNCGLNDLCNFVPPRSLTPTSSANYNWDNYEPNGDESGDEQEDDVPEINQSQNVIKSPSLDMDNINAARRNIVAGLYFNSMTKSKSLGSGFLQPTEAADVKINLFDMIRSKMDKSWRKIPLLAEEFRSPFQIIIFRHGQDQSHDKIHEASCLTTDILIDDEVKKQALAWTSLTGSNFLSSDICRNSKTCLALSGKAPIVNPKLNEININMHCQPGMTKQKASLNAIWKVMLNDPQKRTEITGNESVQDVCDRVFQSIATHFIGMIRNCVENQVPLQHQIAVCLNLGVMNCLYRALNSSVEAPKLFDYLTGFSLNVDLFRERVELSYEGSLIEMMRAQTVLYTSPYIRYLLQNLSAPSVLITLLTKPVFPLQNHTKEAFVEFLRDPEAFEDIISSLSFSEIKELQSFLESMYLLSGVQRLPERMRPKYNANNSRTQ